MKYIPILFLLLFFSEFTGQEPPPRFKFRFQEGFPNIESLLSKYEIATDVFRHRVHRKRCEKSPWKSRILYHKDHSGNYVHIVGYNINLPKKGDIIQLQIKERLSGNTMNLFFKIDHNMRYGDEIELETIPFRQGNYFYNFLSDGKFGATSNKNISIHIEGHELEKRKTSIARINRLF